jgi:hypothetical protein
VRVIQLHALNVIDIERMLFHDVLPGEVVPVVIVGSARGETVYGITIREAHTVNPLVQIRLACEQRSIMPSIIVQDSMAIVAFDQSVVAVSYALRRIVWEYVCGSPIVSMYKLNDYKRLIIAELDLCIIDNEWEVNRSKFIGRTIGGQVIDVSIIPTDS